MNPFPKATKASTYQVKLGLSSDGSILAYLEGGIEVQVKIDQELREIVELGQLASLGEGVQSLSREPIPSGIKVGDKMPDDTIFAGNIPKTCIHIFTELNGKRLMESYSMARAYAHAFRGGGYTDWSIPSQLEMQVLFNNRAAIGGFDEVSSQPPFSDYWVRSQDKEMATLICKNFRSGKPRIINAGASMKDQIARTRLIRKVLPLV